jgi:hypothetical protein
VGYERLEPCVKANGILDLVPSCVNSKCVTSTRGSNQYNAQQEKV